AMFAVSSRPVCSIHPLSLHLLVFFCLFLPRPPRSTVFPYTTLFRSARSWAVPGRCAGRSPCWSSRWGPPTRRCRTPRPPRSRPRSEEHTSELQSRFDLVCRLLLEKKKKTIPRSQILTKGRITPSYDE